MSKPYFIQLFEQATNNFLGKFKFVLDAKNVKEVKDLIVEKLINKKQLESTDQVVIKDNDQYQLGSDDDVNDVIPDGKVKLYVSKSKGSNNFPVVNVPVISQLANLNVNVNSQVQNNPQSNIANNSNNQINSNTSVLDMSGFKLPMVDQNHKFVLKAMCPQIRKSLIEIPLSQDLQNFNDFSNQVIDKLGLSKQLRVVLYSPSGCPYVNNLELSLLNLPKLDYSQVYHIIFTKTLSSCDTVPPIFMQVKANPQTITITKTSVINSLNIKFDIDLSNTVSVLKYRVYQLTKIHPLNQILKFGNNVLANDLQTLQIYNIKKDSIIEVQFKLNSNVLPSTLCDKFYYKDVKLVNQQNQLSLESFRANLIVLAAHVKEEDRNKFLAVLEKYSSNYPLVYAFKSIFENCHLSQTSRVALQEGLYSCILNFIKGLSKAPAIKTDQVFFYIRNFLGFIFESATKIATVQKINSHFQSVNLQNVCTFTLKNIQIPAIIKIDDGQVILVDRKSMIQQINKGFTFDKYKKPKIQDLKTSAQLQDSWMIFKNNHLDNDTFTSLFWYNRKVDSQEFNLSESHCDIAAYVGKIDGYDNLQVNNPLQLKNKCHCPLLLKTKQNRLRIYVSKNKDISRPFNLFNPISGNQQAVNLDLMSGATTTENTQAHINLTDIKPVITREPKQAIVVLFDISGSMGSKFFNQPDLVRIGAVKSFFQAFAYRTIAYNLEHVVSLIFFDDKIEVQCSFTEAIFDFNRLISNAHPRGSTKLYDSIVLAAENLVQFGKKYPDCKLRILALTDGQDNTSRNTYVDAAKCLIDNNITIDSFAVSTSCDGLKTITLATGGKCYLARNLEESLKLFEQETVLSVRVRSPQQRKPNMTLEQLIAKAQLKPFDEVNSVHKFQMPDIKASGTSGKDLAKKLQNQEQVKKFASNNSMKRIIKQIQTYTQDPHPFVSIYPSSDLNYWKILLLGPKDTPYENGLFLLYAKFPNDYPFRAPQIRFITPIYHCNMNSQGRICHSVFDRNYSPALKFKNIVQCVYGLILTPQPQDPLDNVVASFYLSDYQKYLKNAQQATVKNASHTTQKLVEQLYGKIADDIQRQKKIAQINDWIQQAKKHN